jgi:hypothetical protein
MRQVLGPMGPNTRYLSLGEARWASLKADLPDNTSVWVWKQSSSWQIIGPVLDCYLRAVGE